MALNMAQKAKKQAQLENQTCDAAFQQNAITTHQLYTTNQTLLQSLKTANSTINTLDCQLYRNTTGQFDQHMSTELDETFRLVEQLENEVLHLKSEKLRMQVEHDHEIETLAKNHQL